MKKTKLIDTSLARQQAGADGDTMTGDATAPHVVSGGDAPRQPARTPQAEPEAAPGAAQDNVALPSRSPTRAAIRDGVGSVEAGVDGSADEMAGEHEKTYSIGALADEFGITTRTIRFYESRSLLSPNRRGTQRYYTRRDRARLSIILRAKNLGFSLEDVAAYLDLYDADPSQQAQTRLLLQKVETSIASLQKKRADLDRSLRDLKEIRTRCVDHLEKVRSGD